ncbi:uncharacterized protein LOC112023233 [Quercus suber]|uniref:uncharacterized protein LOC112023233 n=1 Tax=Quercus suber TaxID=58331 RepID=UPI000CE1E44B|nr:uncharacterized protein LOC112023233 [Quercus suber]POF11336.1 hypothetical protein CFP56_48167 [Quercus suber]
MDDKLSFNQGKISGASLLQQLIDDLELCELVAKGQKFTWMNNREEGNFVMEKLDRAFASVDWVNAYLNYALRNMPIIRSDHGPIVLDFETQFPFQRRPFRFERMWASHPTWKEVIQKAWSSFSYGIKAYQLQNKLNRVRKDFFQWNKEVFGRVERDIQQKMVQLQDARNSISSIDDVRKERAIREELEILLNRE